MTCDGTREASLFWRDALEWELVWDQDGQTAIQSPQGGTKIGWDTWPASPMAGRSRQRFDLTAGEFDLTAPDLEAEVERLLGLGATTLGRRDGGLALADPGGDEFWITSGDLSSS